MRRFLSWFCVALALFATAPARAALSEDQKAEIRRLADGLQYREGNVSLKNGLASVNVGTQFRFFDAKDAQTVLSKIWRNPPDPEVLGMLIPTGSTPLDPDGWATVITYTNDGYVKDDDAAKIDFNDLLKKMQEGAREANEEREKQGYPHIELLGWATPPHYDAGQHKLYWAKRIQFGDSEHETLNYCIRILGRRGVLELNAVAPMERLADVEQATPTVLSMVNFDQGNRYADFDSKTDKVAEYGIAALIAGGLLAKTGLLKGLLVAIVALKKVIIVGVVAVASFFKKLYAKLTEGKERRLDA